MKILLPALLLAGLVLVLPAWADERILNYHSLIEVQANADLLITETITVRAEGREIRRGIYRDFPTDYKDDIGNRYVVDFEVLEIQRDGAPEGFHTEKEQNGTRVYIGKKSVILPKGTYTYSLKYRTNYQLGFFDQHDELYFNAIGTGWSFSIDQASVEVVVPSSIPTQAITAEGYTGAQGSKGQDIRVQDILDARVRFEVTRGLKPGEGVTVVVGWPKGHVQEPSSQEKLQRLLKHNRPILIAGIGFLVTAVYFLIAWMMVGKDPEKGVIIPEFKPPKNISPAGGRFLMGMKYDNRCFACALINMAVKGSIALEQNGKRYTVRKQRATTEGLSMGEAKLYNALLKSRHSLALEQANHSAIGKAVKSLKQSLKSEFENTCFKRNVGWLAPGFIVTVITVAATFLSTSNPEGAFLGMWLSFWTIGVYFLVRQVWTAWTNPGRSAGDTFGAVFVTLFAIPFIAAEIGVSFFLAQMITPAAIILLIGLLGLNILFYQLIKQPTHIGRKLMDQLEGFKLYLSVAEEESFQAMKGPRKTPELFEAYLPYALALGVEQQWSEKFSEVLEAAGQAPGQAGYRPMWHHGHTGRLDAAAFSSALGGALASAVASSSTAPGSSSGGGGGGFSGGGGGGGGGGGW